jgi:hypothetical protein
MKIQKNSTSKKLDELRKFHDTVFFESDFSFLQGHKGIRKNALSGLVGTSGSGKSTLAKKIGSDCARGSKVLYWLSEEDSTEYELKLWHINGSDDAKRNSSFFSERDLPREVRNNQKEFFAAFKEVYVESGADICILDNVTTSQFYSDTIGPAGQQNSADFLFDFCKKIGTIFYVCHTGKHVTDNSGRLFTSQDMRGTSQLGIRTEYLYIMQKYISDITQHNFINVEKHRFHDDSGGFHLLDFQNGFFCNDAPVPFDRIKEIFHTRNKF